MVTTTSNAFNEQSAKVMNYMQGKRNAEQMVGEFFGLRKEAVYSDDGSTVTAFIDEFKDDKVLKLKRVHLHPKLVEMGITEEHFIKLFDKIPNYGTKGENRSNNKGEGKKDDDSIDGSIEVKPSVSSPKKGTRTTKK